MLQYMWKKAQQNEKKHGARIFVSRSYNLPYFPKYFIKYTLETIFYLQMRGSQS